MGDPTSPKLAEAIDTPAGIQTDLDVEIDVEVEIDATELQPVGPL